MLLHEAVQHGQGWKGGWGVVLFLGTLTLMSPMVGNSARCTYSVVGKM